MSFDGSSGAGRPSLEAASGRYPASGLRTDFYELTMMNGYLRTGMADQRVLFDLFVRTIPEQGGYLVAAGLRDAIDFMCTVRFGEEELAYLDSLGLFDAAFLDRLRRFRFTGTIQAIPEGTPVFPLEPILRVEAPLFEAQYFESALLNTINFQTLIATKAARICQEAGVDNVIEFGMRRAHGVDGALSATRAAYVGGVAATSNTEAGRILGIPVRGTQAHSWVMAFPDELTAFRAYAQLYPRTCVLLVDTYDTLRSGVPNAITVGKELRQRGHRLQGIRLDSGDLAYLSIHARKMLDAAGLADTNIVASGDLDEWIIHDLKVQGARIDTWGVGTRLVTSHNEPSLSGVYKLAAVESDGRWVPRIKLSEGAKGTLPGAKQVWRLTGAEGWFEGDLIAHEDEEPRTRPAPVGFHPYVEYEQKTYEGIERCEPLLRAVIAEGVATEPRPSLQDVRRTVRAQLEQIHPTSRRLLNPHIYKVSITERMLRTRQELRERMRSA